MKIILAGKDLILVIRALDRLAHGPCGMTEVGDAAAALADRLRTDRDRQFCRDFQEYRRAAKECAVEGEIEVDDDAVVSAADNEAGGSGAYVEARLWIPAEDLVRDGLNETHSYARNAHSCVGGEGE